MPSKRMVRVNESIKRALAEEFYRELATEGFDLAAITVARVQTSPDLRDAHVYISILGHQDEREQIIERLQQKHAAFQRSLTRHVKLRYTPRLWFRHDDSFEKGDHILDIISELEAQQEPPPEDTDEQESSQ